MNDHKILSWTMIEGANDAVSSVAGFAFGGLGLFVGVNSAATGVSLFGAEAGALLPAMWIGAGVGGVALGAYAAYEGVTAYTRLNQESNKDAAELKSWMES